jgi:hypothetical protein
VFLLMGGVGSVIRITPGKEAFWSVDAQHALGLADLIVDGQAATINDGILELQVTFEPLFRA